MKKRILIWCLFFSICFTGKNVLAEEMNDSREGMILPEQDMIETEQEIIDEETLEILGETERKFQDEYLESVLEEESETRESYEAQNIEEYSGVCGEHLVWQYNAANQTLTISGNGKMYNYTNVNNYFEGITTDVPWKNYMADVKKVVIGDDITSIGNSAFADFENLERVTLPETLSEIGDQSFARCIALTEIQFPSGLSSLGKSSFVGCLGLKAIALPEGITELKTSVFSACSGLETVELPSGLNSIGQSVFTGCISLKDIQLPDKLVNIEMGAFFNCAGLKTVYLPETIEYIGDQAFQDCINLNEIHILSNKVEIGGNNVFPNSESCKIYCHKNSETEKSLKGYNFVYDYIEDISGETEPGNTEESKGFSGLGEGTELEPYRITNAQQMNEVRYDLTANYILENDIDISTYSNWEAIGTYEEPFVGIFDGENHSIIGMTITEVAVDTSFSNQEGYENVYAGLFGYCKKNNGEKQGEIKNLKVKNVSVKLYDNAGSICIGIISAHKGTISNCSVDGVVDIKRCRDIRVGGISASGGNIQSCISNVDMYIESNKKDSSGYHGEIECGGITAYYGNISYSMNHGDITAISGNFLQCGGISGSMSSISGCANYGEIVGKTMYSELGRSGTYNCEVGGIVGGNGGDIKECVNYGDIEGQSVGEDNARIAGIVGGGGWMSECESIRDCFNLGKSISDLSMNPVYRIGCSKKIERCYSLDSSICNGEVPSDYIGTDKKNGESLDYTSICKMIYDKLGIGSGGTSGNNSNDYIIERVRAYTSGQMSDRLNVLLGSDLPFELRFQKINELFCNYGMLDAKEGIAYLRDTLDERRAFEAMTTNEIYTACDFTTWIRSNDAKAIATRAGLYSSALLLNGEYKDYLKPSTYLQDATPEVKKYKSMFYDFMQAGGDKVAYETALEGAQQLLYLLEEKQEVSTEVFNAYMSKFSFSKTVEQVDSYINELLGKIDKNAKIDFEVPSDSTFGKIIGGTGKVITIASMGIEDYKLYSKISSTAEVYGQYEEFLYDIAYGENDLPSCMKAAAAQVMNECENQIEAVTSNIAGQIADYCKDKAEGVVFEAAGLGVLSEATSVIDFGAFVSNTLISMNEVVEKEACIEAYAVLSDYYAAKLIQDKSNFLADDSEKNAWTFYKDYNLLYQLREEGEKAYLAMCEPTLENGILVFILGNGKGYQEKADVVKQNLDYLEQHCQFDLPDAVEEQLGSLYKQKVMASCPVDMAVYNPNGDLICTIKDGAASDVVNEHGRFVCTYRAATGDYVKIAYLNSADNYKVKLTGTDTGVVSVSYAKANETGGSIVYSTDYDTIIPKASMEFNTYELPGKVNVDSDADGKNDTSIEMKEDGQPDIRVTGIEVEKEAITLEAGQTIAVGVDVLPANAAYKDVEWTVADSAVAVVTNGKIEAKAPGETTVTVKTLDGGYEAHISVTVAEEKRPEEYAVTYNANGGKSAPSSQKKIHGEALKLTNSKPTKAYTLTYNANGGNVSNETKSVSCTFKNWNTKADGKETSYAPGASYTKDAAVTLYAQWTNPKAGALATPTRSGYTFDGWYTSANGGSKVTSGTTISKDMTLYAHWNKKAVSEPQYKDDVEAFVAQLYKVCLSRNPDAGGLNTWTTRLKNKQETGVSAAYGFVFSNEFKAKNLCNDDYVEQLYAAFMGRKADASGKATWINLLESGTIREEVFNGFALSNEFAGLCSKYGIEQGKGVEIPKFGTIPTGACAICGKEDGVTGFVTRLYQVCLNRKPDAGGLKDWRTRLCEHTSSGREVAYGFIFSQEFIGKKYSNADYVEHLYEAFMGRSSDAAGKKMWVDYLNKGWSREKVFDGFVGSDEFTKICNSYGIVRD